MLIPFIRATTYNMVRNKGVEMVQVPSFVSGNKIDHLEIHIDLRGVYLEDAEEVFGRKLFFLPELN